MQLSGAGLGRGTHRIAAMPSRRRTCDDGDAVRCGPAAVLFAIDAFGVRTSPPLAAPCQLRCCQAPSACDAATCARPRATLRCCWPVLRAARRSQRQAELAQHARTPGGAAALRTASSCETADVAPAAPSRAACAGAGAQRGGAASQARATYGSRGRSPSLRCRCRAAAQVASLSGRAARPGAVLPPGPALLPAALRSRSRTAHPRCQPLVAAGKQRMRSVGAWSAPLDTSLPRLALGGTWRGSVLRRPVWCPRCRTCSLRAQGVH